MLCKQLSRKLRPFRLRHMSDNNDPNPTGVPLADGRRSSPRERILTARRLRHPFLQLAVSSLTAFPPEICEMTWLRELDLDINQISVVPPEIGQLINLRSLKLSSNNITNFRQRSGISKAFGNSDINRNPILSLPPEIGKLKSLRSLHAIETRPVDKP